MLKPLEDQRKGPGSDWYDASSDGFTRKCSIWLRNCACFRKKCWVKQEPEHFGRRIDQEVTNRWLRLQSLARITINQRKKRCRFTMKGREDATHWRVQSGKTNYQKKPEDLDGWMETRNAIVHDYAWRIWTRMLRDHEWKLRNDQKYDGNDWEIYEQVMPRPRRPMRMPITTWKAVKAQVTTQIAWKYQCLSFRKQKDQVPSWNDCMSQVTTGHVGVILSLIRAIIGKIMLIWAEIVKKHEKWQTMK